LGGWAVFQEEYYSTHYSVSLSEIDDRIDIAGIVIELSPPGAACPLTNSRPVEMDRTDEQIAIDKFGGALYSRGCRGKSN
jgi:hypothetical protein